MIRRFAINQVESALKRQAAVGLIGPRQVGKTTLAFEIAKERPSIYLDLESQSDRNKLQDPELFLKAHVDKLVILDEIHRMPGIFQSLRGLIDEGRRAGNRVGRFLILGAASIDLLRQSSETLAGRIEYIELAPLTILEVSSHQHEMNTLWLRGGFPDSYLASSDFDSFLLRQNFIRTYLERDVPQFGPRIASELLSRLWTMLAHSQGSKLNNSKLAASLGISAPTVASYVDLLVDLLLVRRLTPYYINVGKRLVKSAKTYISDSGLLHALLGIQQKIDLDGHPIIGYSWEGFVIETLLVNAPLHTKASYYATAAGAEIDLLLELGGQHGLWAIEIKLGLSPKPSRGFYEALKDLKPAKSFVVYSGEVSYPLTEDTQVIGLYELAKLLQEL